MNTPSPPVPPEPPSDDDDAALAERLAALTERLIRNEGVDLDDDDPHADELRGLLPTIRMIRTLAGPTPPAADLGTIGDFRIVREVGRGGMGVVYEALQVSLFRRVALKVLPGGPALDPRHTRRFEVEARAAASLHHPHIVPVFATGAEGGVLYYAMQFIAGRNLARVIEAWARQAPDGASSPDRFRRVAELGRQAAEALAHAHAHDVIHRDIKPSNLLIDESDHLWVTDFGLARTGAELDLTRTGDNLGTPRYMSPEQVVGGRAPVDGRIDVYALGVTLYEALTLRPPFDGDDRLRLLRQIVEETPPPPRRLNPALPADLETIVLKAMARDPAERYASARDLADDLRRFLDDRPILARRPTPAERAGKWARRHRRVVAAASVVFAVAALGLTVGAWRYTTWLRRYNAALRVHAARATRAERRMGTALDLARRQQRLAEQHLYAANLRLARQALDLGQVERAQEILKAAETGPAGADERGFAWRYLWRLARREIGVYEGHRAEVFPLTLGPGGRVLATGDAEGVIVLSDVDQVRMRRRWKGHAVPVRCLAFSPDGARLASFALDANRPGRGEVRVWDTATGRRLAGLDGLRARVAVGLAFAAGGRRLVVAYREGEAEEAPTRVELFDLAGGAGPPEPVRHALVDARLGFALDGGHLAAVRYLGSLTVSETETFSALWTASGGDAALGWPAFSGDGRWLAAEDGRSAVVREVVTGLERNRVHVDRSPQIVDQLVLNADGTKLLVVHDPPAEITLFDLAGSPSVAHEIVTIRGPDQHRVVEAVFSPDGSKVVATTRHRSGGQGPVLVWESLTGRLLRTYPGRSRQGGRVLFTPDGGSVLLNRGSGVQRWWLAPPDGDPPVVLAGHADEAWSVAFSPDGQTLASGSDDTSGDPTLKLWDVATGRLVRGWRTGPGTVAALAFSPDGRTLASAALNPSENLRLWDAATGRLRATLEGHTDRVRSVAYSPDGTWLASAGSDGTVRLWDGATGRPLATLTGHTDAVRKVAFSPDGRTLASGSNDRTVRLWDVATVRLLRAFRGPEPITALAVAPDGSLVAAADQGGTIRRWSLSTGAPLAPIHSDDSEPFALSFSPDGRSLAAAGVDQVVRVWAVLTGQELLALRGHAAPIYDLAFSPDGSTLATASHDGAVRLWRSEPP